MFARVPYMRQRLITAVILLSLLAPQLSAAQQLRLPNSRTSSPRTCDPLTCQLQLEIVNTDNFLRARKNGLPYTPDPRNLTPQVEELRLNELSQTMGYLNLYRRYKTALYKQEAIGRVDYLLSLGATALGNGPRDGMYAYMFLDAYQQFHDQRYRDAGVAIANTLVNLPDKDLVMNGGLMAALGLDAAYQVTGTVSYRTAARRAISNTAPKQFPDGAFPHLPTLAGGKNLSYTSWMAIELLLLGTLDSQDPNVDFLTLKTADFIDQRVLTNGTLEYANDQENFDSDPGNVNAGYGHSVADLFAAGLSLAATGKTTTASSILRTAFSYRLSGTNFGGYPDVYGSEVVLDNPWVNGYPSILRTSLIFWYMTIFQAFSASCTQGTAVSCTTTINNCNPAMASAGVCQLGILGTQTCLAGRYSACLDLPNTSMQSGQACGQTTECIQTYDGSCQVTCTHYGSRVCWNQTCAPLCQDIDLEGQPAPTCTSVCHQGIDCAIEPATRRITTQPSPAPICPVVDAAL